MATAYSASGATISIAAAVTTEPANAAAFAALSWTAIGSVNSLGEYGDQSQILTATTLQENRVFKGKGPRDAGTLELVVLDRYDDAGQVALIAAQAAMWMYPFKITLPNNLNSPGTAQIDYFCAFVVSQRLNVGRADNIVMRTFQLAINTKVTTTAPT